MESEPLLVKKPSTAPVVGDDWEDGVKDVAAPRSHAEAWEAFVRESERLWLIAAPITFNILCLYGVNCATQLFAGRLGNLELSAAAVGLSVVSNFSFGFLLGMGSALETLCRQAHGTGHVGALGVYMQRSWIILAVSALLLSLLYVFATPILRMLGQDDVHRGSRSTVRGKALSPDAAPTGFASLQTTPASKGGATTVHVQAQCARDQAAGDCVGCLRPAAKVAVLRSRCYLPLEEKMSRCRGPFAAIMVALLVVARLEGTAAYGYTTHYFPQELDHFSFTPASSTVFYHRYLVNDSFWARSHVDGKVAGPIFVYTGNESPVETFVNNTGFMFDIAPKFGALLVFIEHRYYGESLPFGNHSYESPEKLGYLTSTQALADYALLINSLKNNFSAVDSPVVVFGGSYGGMLAAWFRLKYPHVAIGALAASAPVLMFDNITPWESFYDALSQDYKSESLNCFSVIKEVWDVIYERGSTKKGLLELSKTFRACRTVPSARMFVTWLEDAFKFTTLFDYPIPVKFVKNLPAYPVKEMCKIIDGFSGGADVVQKVFAAASLYYNDTGKKPCFDIEKAGDPLGPVFQWQACTEMILPMTSSNFSMFPPLEFSYQSRSDSCFRKFKVKPRPHWITAEFGGTKIEQVLKRFGSNIIFSNGLRDPLSRGGVLKNISSSIIALVAEKGAHHFDLRGATMDDPDWAVEQRRQEAEIIQGWIDQYYDDTA